MIYLDYQATTPVAPEVAEAMWPWIEDKFANPHSPSTAGREAAAAIEVARAKVAAMLPQGGRIVFTSGATEALNWAIKGSGTGDIVTIATEHAAVLDSVGAIRSTDNEARILPVGSDGIVDLDAASQAIVPGVGLVAAMLVNNEIGVIQPITELSKLAHFAGGVLLCDVVQGFGRIEIPDGCDLISVSAHKIHGPKGVGALWIRDGIDPPEPLLHGGGQEQGLRSGTLSPALCVGFGVAAKLAAERRDADHQHVERLWQAAIETLGGRWTINGSTDHRYHGNLNIRREGLDATRLIADLRDVAFSLGSACASGSGRPSHVLRALGLSDREARSSIRIGFGRYTTKEELIDALTRIDAAARAQENLAA